MPKTQSLQTPPATPVADPSPSRVRCDVDFDRPGRQAAYLKAPQSRNTSGWGVVEIPIYVFKNGKGPTLLLTGGVHGDEYEGQIAISRLAQTLDVKKLKGRLILIPAVNMPAALNATRLSPIDGRDMNRCFPGNPKGTFSEMLAHFIDSKVLPHVDVSVDMHTAGHSADCVPSTNMHYVADAALRGRTMDAAAAFGAPYNVVFWGAQHAQAPGDGQRQGRHGSAQWRQGHAPHDGAGCQLLQLCAGRRHLRAAPSGGRNGQSRTNRGLSAFHRGPGPCAG